MKSLLTAVLLAVTMTIFAAQPVPSKSIAPQTIDFDKPKTTLAQAERDLAVAQRDGRESEVVSNLLIIARAETEIDPTSLPVVIARVEDDSRHLDSIVPRALAYMVRARLTNAYYNSSRWKFDNRQLPSAPLPKDMSEWSGDMFKSQIQALVDSALIHREVLYTTPITDYPAIVEIAEVAVPYYPTVLDFILDTVGRSQSAMRDVAAEGMAAHAPGSLPWMNWAVKSITANSEQRTANKFNAEDSLRALVDEYIDNPNCSLALIALGQAVAQQAFDRQAEYYALASDFIRQFPDCPRHDAIENILQTIAATRIDTESPSLCVAGRPFDIKVEALNAESITIDLFKGTNTEQKNVYNDPTIKPVLSRTIELPGKRPFKRDTTVSITLDKTGEYFYIVRPTGRHEKEPFRREEINCVNVYPFILGVDSIRQIIVCDPVTGAPLQGVDVRCNRRQYNTGKTTSVSLGKTDADGKVDCKGLKDWEYYTFLYTYKGLTSTFSQTMPGSPGYEPGSQSSLSIMTDRAIYHRGDSIHWVAVAAVGRSHRGTEPTDTIRAQEGIKLLIRLLDANGQEVESTTLTTDELGRVSGTFRAPEECLSGVFTITAHGTEPIGQAESPYGACNITVSDYKMPEFEVTVTSVKRDTPEAGAVTITGQAKTYSGIALEDATVSTDIRQSSWWSRGIADGRVLCNIETRTDSDGHFETVVWRDSLHMTQRPSYGPTELYEACINVTSPTGETQRTFQKVVFGKPYTIDTSAQQVIDRAIPLKGYAKAYDADGKPVDIDLRWTLHTDTDPKEFVASGNANGEIRFPASVKPGKYMLDIAPADTTLAEPTSRSVTIYDLKSDIIPAETIFLPEHNFEIASGQRTVDVNVGCAVDKAVVFYQTFDRGKIETRHVTLHKGWNKIAVTLPETDDNANHDQPYSEYALRIFGVHDLDVIDENINVKISRKSESLTIATAEAFRDNLVPGATEQWHFKITGPGGKASKTALVIDMYNRALDIFGTHTLAIRPHDRLAPSHSGLYTDLRYTSNWSRSMIWPYPSENKTRVTEIVAPCFRYIGNDFSIFSPYNGRRYAMTANAPMSAMPAMTKSNSVSDLTDSAIATEESVEDEVYGSVMVTDRAGEDQENTDGDTTFQQDTFKYRDAETPVALWRPMLTTDDDGNVDLHFTVPDANASWRLLTLAWDKTMLSGSLSHTFTAAKPIMVSPNLPRFVRAGDLIEMSTAVTNNTDTAAMVKTVVEIFNPMTGAVTATNNYDKHIAAGETDVIETTINITSTDIVGVRVRSSIPGFTDGEQNVLPVLPSKQIVIDTDRFYMSPTDTIWTATISDNPDTSTTLELIDNPVWSVVSALPSLLTPGQNTAAAYSATLFSAAVGQGLMRDNPRIADWLRTMADTTLISPLEKNAMFRTAVLNSTPWVQAAQDETEQMQRLSLIFNDTKTTKDAIAALQKLQGNDGGWRWGEWDNNSSPFITLLVLERIGRLRSLGYLPKDKTLDKMINSALRYIDNKVEKTDTQYTLIRTLYYNDKPNTSGGKNVINKTIAEMKKHWKEYPVGAKANAAEVLWKNGYHKLAGEIISSVEEFAVITHDRGAEFPSSPSIKTTTNVLYALMRINPKDSLVDELRRNLITRKRSQNWGSVVNTTDAVAAILSCGTRWTDTNTTTTITVGTDTIAPPATADCLPCCGRLIDLSPYPGKEVTITRTAPSGSVPQPAFGSLQTASLLTLAQIEASDVNDLSIEKTMLIRRDMEWVDARDTSLNVGDLVRVTLTIHNNAQRLDYVTITDQRPAALEPIDQTPRWLWREGIGFYLENNDSQTNLYVTSLPKGTYILTYDMRINNAGSYTSGVATLQSQYAPEYIVHSAIKKIRIE